MNIIIGVTFCVVLIIVSLTIGGIIGSEDLLHRQAEQSLLTQDLICQWELEHNTYECIHAMCSEYK